MSDDNRVRVICPHCGTKIAVDKRKLETHGRCLRCQKIFLLTRFPERRREPAIPMPTREFAMPPRPSSAPGADAREPLKEWWQRWRWLLIPAVAVTVLLVLLFVWPTLAIIYLFIGVSFLSSRRVRLWLIRHVLEQLTRP